MSLDAALTWVQANAGQVLLGLLVAAAFLAAWSLWSGLALRRLNRRVRTLFPAGNTSLEDLVLSLAHSVEEVSGRAEDIRQRTESVAAQMSYSPRHLGLVRFNAFTSGGSNLSFALAMLDDHGSGLVLSSIYGREESRIYVKPVHLGSSTHTLTNEEKEAIRNARRQYIVQEGNMGRGAK